MPKSFNFYQDNYTVGSTGIVPFYSFFTGIYFPLSTEQSLKISLLEDDFSRPVNILTIISGVLDKELKDEKDLFFNFYGELFPSSSDSGNLSFSYTGKVNKDNIDTVLFDIPFNCKVSGDYNDINNINLNLTGNINSGWNLRTDFLFSCTGQQVGNLIDINEYFIGFNGNINYTNKDDCFFEFSLDEIICTTGAKVVRYNDSDIFGIDFSINNIIYETA